MMRVSENKSTLADEIDERIVPDETDKGIISIHLKRYGFAGEFCCGKRVLDVACGVGYGSYYLGSRAAFVVGIDCSPGAIEYARRRYQHGNVEFHKMDAQRLSFPANSFDVVCSFETIEHLLDIQAYLSEVTRVLKQDGTYLVSTPCVLNTTTHPKNPFHFVEWSPLDFKRLLLNYFCGVRLFGQIRKQTFLHRFLQKADIFNLHLKMKFPAFTKKLSQAIGTTPFSEMSLDDLEIIENEFHRADTILGVCAGSRKSVLI